jgi:beta-glucosidase-like glycosyl hydrolase/CubicO group peptidase (beta-lactamase class C family)
VYNFPARYLFVKTLFLFSVNLYYQTHYMKGVFISVFFAGCFIHNLLAQYNSRLSADQWVDSVFQSMNDDERIAQLMVVRAHSNLGPDHVAKVVNDIKRYNIGALCFFQGGPVRQANLTNYYQSISKTPLMITIDGEWGLGMRLDSIIKFPYQLTLGAMNDEALVYEMGKAVGEQHKRLGIHVNYAPVVDVNNNPNNPVIGYRSFGEDKYRVAKLGIAYMKGMQDAGIMACAKHFPGHGDTEVDSHADLPLINKTRTQLDSMELYPFREIFNAGVGSVMIAHLSIPSIDNTKNVATSISKNNVTGLLRNDLKFAGLTFTDALEMKGVAKYFPGGTIAVEAVIAGNDMLCLPENIGMAVEEIKKAIKDKRLTWDEVYIKTRKVLLAKYNLGLYKEQKISLQNLTEDLNSQTNAIRYKVAKEAVTVLSQAGLKASRSDYAAMPLKAGTKIAYVGIGASQVTPFGKRMKENFDADIYLYSWKDGDEKTEEVYEAILKNKYDAVVVGIHDFSYRPANNYGITRASLALWRKLNFIKTITVVFGNVLAAQNYCEAYTLVAAHQDDNVFQQVAADLVEGKIGSSGKLPVRVCSYAAGTGIEIQPYAEKKTSTKPAGEKFYKIDSIIKDAIEQKAFPGCVVMALKDGEIIYNKAFGKTQYETGNAVSLENIFDLASVTKISATTISVMKLYEQGRLDLHKTIGDYLPWVRGTDKANLQIDDLLLHRAGLVPFIPFYKETIDTITGIPNPAIYAPAKTAGFSIPVAKNIYLRNDWRDTIFSRILNSPLGSKGRYVYSDNDFIFLGKIVEQISGMPLNEYVNKTFYAPLGLNTTGFNPLNRFSITRIVPTEEEKHFRRQLLQGYVHDEGAGLFGGVAGHAGLFSSAYDLAMLYQLLLNGGEWNGTRLLKSRTVRLFTSYHSDNSRRGYGFDKPEKDNATRKEPYPSALASPEAFGHTGFTGTCVWVDPRVNLVYVFLSNRVNPTRNNNKLSQMLIRGKIQDEFYKAIQNN